MTIKKWTAGIAVLALAASPAFAVESVGQWNYDQQIELTGCDDFCCGYDCGDGCCDCGDGCGCGAGVAGFSLGSLLGLDNWGIDFGGWTQLGYHDEATLLTPVGGASFNDTPDHINLHQQYFYIGRQADGSRGLDFGFRFDAVYGIDGPDTQSFGNDPGNFDFQGSFTRGDDNHGWALPQLYGEVAMGDFSVIVGHFYTLVGYEVVPAPDNFFYSHSLTQYNSEPFTHTGVLTTYEGIDGVTLYNGWTLGWDTGFDQLNAGSNYLGGFGVELSDSVNLTYITTYGNFGWIDNGGDDSYGHSVVLDANLTDNLEYVFQTDYLRTDNTDFDTFGINQYLFYGLSDRVRLGSRVEWWKADGVSFYEYTSGVNVRLADCLIWRPEYRQDWSPALDYDEEIFGMDMILTY